MDFSVSVATGIKAEVEACPNSVTEGGWRVSHVIEAKLRRLRAYRVFNFIIPGLEAKKGSLWISVFLWQLV